MISPTFDKFSLACLKTLTQYTTEQILADISGYTFTRPARLAAQLAQSIGTMGGTSGVPSPLTLPRYPPPPLSLCLSLSLSLSLCLSLSLSVRLSLSLSLSLTHLCRLSH